MIKKVITSGCSFSDTNSPIKSWPVYLQDYFLTKDDTIQFEHRGLAATGQELIQKKASLALIESLKIYKPEEILVVVMWSGNDRRAFFIDSDEMIASIINQLKVSIQVPGRYKSCFYDLNNKMPNSIPLSHGSFFNKFGGWYTMGPWESHLNEFTRIYYELGKNDSFMNSVISSLENMIFLQNLCKLKGVTFLQQYFTDTVYSDIVRVKDDYNIKYLYDQLNHDTIVSYTSPFNYLQPNKSYFSEDLHHPNSLGHSKWTTEILIPKIEELRIC